MDPTNKAFYIMVYYIYNKYSFSILYIKFKRVSHWCRKIVCAMNIIVDLNAVQINFLIFID